jgi:formylglycine-generating enzyme required for sulfatase activity
MPSIETLLSVVMAVLAAGCASDGTPSDGGADAASDADTSDSGDADATDGDVEPCPSGMVLIDDGEGQPFCIDRFEHPNQEGQAPTVGLPWFRAREACVEAGTAICLEEQWTRACAGTPVEACQGPIGASGLRPECESSTGVRDMPGNVAEWTAEPGGSVTFMARGGSGEDSDIGCQVREEIDAEQRDVDLGLRCCTQPRRGGR